MGEFKEGLDPIAPGHTQLQPLCDTELSVV